MVGLDIVCESPAMRACIRRLVVVADVDSTVLIEGESGVGKDLAAQVIHTLSQRKHAPLVRVNCAAIPDSLLEAELFGYAPGAFTGAISKGRKGLVIAAHQGTLFLDEIGELGLALQPKLLHLIEDKKCRPIGSTEDLTVDVRVIAATNKCLDSLVQQGRFRSDLFYRLNVIDIAIPPLRERKEDIVPLLNHFLDRFNKAFGRRRRYSSAVIQRMLEYSWPGNVRELRNTVERLVVISRRDEISVEDLPKKMTQHDPPRETIEIDAALTLPEAVAMVERELITRAYRRHESSYKVARRLGISQSAAYRKIREYCIEASQVLDAPMVEP